jgi:mannose-6-phosphate isomerase-like protein (cupin superfamily)
MHDREVKIVIGGLLVVLLMLTGPATHSDVGQMLADFARTCGEVAPAKGEIVVQFDVTPPGEQWYVSLDSGGTAAVHRGVHEAPAMTLAMSGETLERIHKGELTAFTAAGKGSGADAAPLEVEFGAAAERLEDPKGMMLGFLQHFFERERPERIQLGEEHSRVVHGAHVIPLYYAAGFRSAWYLVKDGQQLNEPGDTNPYPQAFVIISGRGSAKIGDAELEVSAGESYYIPPNSDHVLRAAPGETLTVIWMAWGEGA